MLRRAEAASPVQLSDPPAAPHDDEESQHSSASSWSNSEATPGATLAALIQGHMQTQGCMVQRAWVLQGCKVSQGWCLCSGASNGQPGAPLRSTRALSATCCCRGVSPDHTARLAKLWRLGPHNPSLAHASATQNVAAHRLMSRYRRCHSFTEAAHAWCACRPCFPA